MILHVEPRLLIDALKQGNEVSFRVAEGMDDPSMYSLDYVQMTRDGVIEFGLKHRADKRANAAVFTPVFETLRAPDVAPDEANQAEPSAVNLSVTRGDDLMEPLLLLFGILFILQIGDSPITAVAAFACGAVCLVLAVVRAWRTCNATKGDDHDDRQ